MKMLTRFLVVLLFGVIVSAAFAQEDFSADIVDLAKGKTAETPRIYVSKDKMRVEGMGQGNRMGGAVIINAATQTSSVLMPERKMYMEFPSGQGPGAQRTWNFFHVRDIDNACSDWVQMSTNHGGSCKKDGAETVNGRNTVKYEGTNSNGETNYVWLDHKIAFPIKWQGKNSSGELQNIKEGAQPASLFEIPSDYQKMQMPMGMPNIPTPR